MIAWAMLYRDANSPWACLKMNLETRIARFHHDVVVRNLEFVETFYVNRERSAPETYHSAVKLMVARNRRKIFEGQI